MRLIVKESAYKWGFEDNDIMAALENPLSMKFIDQNKIMVGGFSADGVLLEVILRRFEMDQIVFHCRKLTNANRRLLNL